MISKVKNGALQKIKPFFSNIYIVGTLLSLIIFFIDLKVELGVAIGVLYATVLFANLWLLSKTYIYWFTASSTLFIFLGYFLSVPGGEPEKVILNRGLSIFIVWIVALFSWRDTLAREQLKKTNRKLEKEKSKQKQQLDITTRKLEGNEQILSSLIHHIAEGLIIFDSKGTIISINLAGQKIFGYAHYEVVGKNIELIIPGPSLSRSDLFFVHFLKSGFADMLDKDFEIFGKNKSGNVFPARVSIGSFSGENEVLYSVVVSDISEQRKEIIEKEKIIFGLTLANQELENFAHIISHDLKEPVRGISSNVEWILEDHSHELSEPLKKLFLLLKGNSKRLQTLIRGILEYCKYGIADSDLTMIDTGLLVKEIVGSLHHPPGIVISMNGEFPTVKYNRTQLTQVFQNLISNSLKYMGKPKGEVNIECVEEEDFWRFYIDDTGKGIENRHFKRIFEMFRTLSEVQDPNSAGIGLAIVKKIIEFYGGSIEVDSVVGKGSTFCFTIPKKVTNLKMK